MIELIRTLPMSIGQRSYHPGLCLRWARKPDGDSVLGSWVGRVSCYYQVGSLRMAVMVSILLLMTMMVMVISL